MPSTIRIQRAHAWALASAAAAALESELVARLAVSGPFSERFYSGFLLDLRFVVLVQAQILGLLLELVSAPDRVFVARLEFWRLFARLLALRCSLA